jgi:transposase
VGVLIFFMRGDDVSQGSVFSYVSAEQRVPLDHPLRVIRAILDEALSSLSPHFDTLYAKTGRPSIAPEKLLRASMLQVLYSVRSERQLMEQMNYNLLFRWFVGLTMDDPIWDVTVFTKNRARLMDGAVSEQLLLAVLEQAYARQLLSQEHFTLDGTLIQAWASRRSFEKKDPPDRGTGARGRKLLRDTHQSKTDPDSRLFKKSAAGMAVPSYLGHVLTENRNGLVVQAMATEASSTAEREAGLAMLDRMRRRAGEITVGADKSYQREEFVAGLRERKARPHVAEHAASKHWPNFLTEAERADSAMAISQRKRKLVETVFGWAKLDRGLRQVKLRGLRRVDWQMRLIMVAHNLRRMHTLLQPA